MQKHILMVLLFLATAFLLSSCSFQGNESEHARTINQSIQKKDSIQAIQLLDSLSQIPPQSPEEIKQAHQAPIDPPRN
ncbi:MAG: hypothetical protein AAFY71_06180 [Bacteroidota bacterium]